SDLAHIFMLCVTLAFIFFCFFFQAEDGIRDRNVTGVQTCALPILIELSTGSFVSGKTAHLSCSKLGTTGFSSVKASFKRLYIFNCESAIWWTSSRTFQLSSRYV